MMISGPIAKIPAAIPRLRIRALLTAALALLLSACAAIGPRAIHENRPRYNIAVQETESQQLLLNIVRQRYSDPILFLEVTSISSGYSGTANANFLANLFTGSNDIGAAFGAGLGETPFIFYAPNSGEKFVRQMLTPLDLRTVTLILQSGWSVERLLLIIGQSINDLRNAHSDADGGAGYRSYQQVLSALRDLQRDGLITVGKAVEKDGDESAGKDKKKGKKEAEEEEKESDGNAELALLIAPEAVQSEQFQLICKAIDVACDGRPLRLQQAFGAAKDGETLALATRSLFSALYFLGQGVEVPPEDAADGSASRSARTAGSPFEASGSGGSLFRVLSSDDEPEGAAVKVFYRDHWFYIADSDADSKTTFALLSMLVTLQSGDSAALSPLVSLPIN